MNKSICPEQRKRFEEKYKPHGIVELSDEELEKTSYLLTQELMMINRKKRNGT